MVITCEQCQTRFRVDAQQIPAAGVRVRCSQCQHRFFVEPQDLPVLSDEPEPVVAEDSSPSGAGIAPGTDDIDFDNPEFLYDPGDEDPSVQEDAAAPEVESDQSDEQAPGVGFEIDSRGSLELPVGAGNTGPDLTESGEPGLGLEYDLQIPGFEGPDPAPHGAEAARYSHRLDPLLEPPTPKLDPDPGQLADERPPAALPGPALPEVPPAKPVLDVSENDLLDWEHDLAEFDEKPDPESPVQAGAEAIRRAAATASVEVASARLPGLQGRVAGSFARTRPALAVAFALGLALAGIGGWRAISFGSGPLPGPAVVEAHGWVATGFDVFHWRSPLGARFLVIRGNLYAVGPQAVPGVRVTLIGAEGQAVDEPVWARLEHFRDREPLGGAAAAQSGPRRFSRADASTLGVTGFSLWIPDPPSSARRFQLDLVPAPRASARLPG